MLLNWRTTVAWVYDLLAAALATGLSYFIRLQLDADESAADHVLRLLPWTLPAQALCFQACRLYAGLWRYASLPDLRRIAVAAVLATLLVPLIVLMLQLPVLVPRSVLVMMPLLMILFMAGGRIAYRMWRERDLVLRGRTTAEPVVIVGAGDTTATLLRSLRTSPLYRPIALLDDDPRKRGRVIFGVRVMGGTRDFARVAREVGAQTAIVSMPGADPDVRRAAVEACAQAGAKVLTVPSVEDLLAGAAPQFRKVQVADVLGRESVELDVAALERSFAGRCVMVTGAGGSIGAELCRQLARFQPGLLVALDLSEFALYTLTEDLRLRCPGLRVVAVVADVKHAARVERVLAEYRPAVVFHAAAYKHVPLMEETNAWEAIRNNAYGTWVLGQAAVRQGVERFVLVSTDKAVHPVNVMGASKRLAERVCQSLATPEGTRFEVVRFGNVLGSSGSVIPKFQEQIDRGVPVTVTHPEMVRYFMSIPEAAQLVLQAGAMGQGGEVFVLDMGPPVKIVDLARTMIRLSGHNEAQIPIVFTGLRPGEKLYEELLFDDEATLPTPHPKVRIVRGAEGGSEAWLREFLGWVRQERLLGDDEVRRDLRRFIPEYVPATSPELRVVAGGAA